MAKRKKNIQAPAIQPILPVSQQETNFLNVPESTATNFVLDILGAGGSIADLPDRKTQVSNNTKYEVIEDGQRRQISLENDKAKVTIELADIDKLLGSNKSAKKLFVLSLIKANEQALHNGQLTKEYVSFPLQELIDNGFYSTPQSARKGFSGGADTLTSLKLKGYIQQTNKRGDKVEIDALEVLFTGARIEKGQCYLFLNPRIDWSFFAQYFTILPPYYFRLPNRASDLLYYIFYLARQHTKDIEEKGYFNISFRAIQQRLQLPNEKKTKNPQRDIKEAIEDALEQIEEAHSTYYGNTEFALLPVYNEEDNIADYLDNGYLQISLKGAFAQRFIEISKETAKQIAEEQKRRQRISERAIANNMAKKLQDKSKGKDKARDNGEEQKDTQEGA